MMLVIFNTIMKVNHCPLIKESLQLVQVLTAMQVFPVNHRDQGSPVPCCARSGHDVRLFFLFVCFLLLEGITRPYRQRCGTRCCRFQGAIVCYQCPSQEVLKASPETCVGLMQAWVCRVLVSVCMGRPGSFCYSQAILPSKLESAMAKAWTAHSG